MKKKYIIRIMILFITALFMQQMLQEESKACNVAVVSAAASATGRPFIWKNRDHTTSYRHRVIYYPEVKSGVGGSLRLMGETYLDTTSEPANVCTGGTNESGFAIANTTCIDAANDPFDMYNVNTNLIEKSLELCRTLAEFEVVARNYSSYWSGSNISGIFAVIDAHGGAAIYEMWTNGNGTPMMFRRFDVDTGNVTDQNGARATDSKYAQTTGFNNRTNSHHTAGWIEIPSDSPRELRARQLLTAMKANRELTPRNVMRFISKDVCGGTPADYFTDPDDPTAVVSNNWDISSGDTYLNPNRGGQMFTRYCISRYQTTMGLVIEGAATPEEANLTTMWVALGEPSLSVFIPFFPYAQQTSKYTTDNKHGNSGYYWDGVSTTSSTKPTGFLNLLFDCVQSNPFSSRNFPELNTIYKNISLYSNNGCPYLTYPDTASRGNGNSWGSWGYQMDTCINYPRLITLQTWTLPLEEQVYYHTDDFLNTLRSNPSLVTRDVLAEFSDYSCEYVYKNYTHQSAFYTVWSHDLPDDSSAPEVISVDPLNGSAKRPGIIPIIVKFSEPVDDTTINEGSFVLKKGGIAVNGSVTYNSLQHTATLMPYTALENGSTYMLTVTTAIEDLYGNHMAADFYSTFTTSSDAGTGVDPGAGEINPETGQIIPVITSVNTGNSGEVFPVDNSITVQFNESMDPNTINNDTFIVFTNEGVVVPGTVVYDATTNTAIFTPDSPLEGGTTYTVDLTDGITTTTGESLPDDYTWTFTTSPEIIGLAIVNFIPADQEIEFPVNGVISAEFNRIMDETSINTDSFRLSTDGTDIIEGTVAYDSSANIASFTPVIPLAANTAYTAVLTGDVKDADGNFLTETTWTFTTGSAVGSSSAGSSGGGGCGCGSSADAATFAGEKQPLLPGLASLLGTMLFPLSLIWLHRKRRKKL